MGDTNHSDNAPEGQAFAPVWGLLGALAKYPNADSRRYFADSMYIRLDVYSFR